jgi:NAD(P)-dependent dehydrogenase (short-subunit alcohol dehydrogenase family)
MKISFTNKVALVTGAGAELGPATAEAFAGAGASAVLADVDEAAMQAAADEISPTGHQALTMACHVSDESRRCYAHE